MNLSRTALRRLLPLVAIALLALYHYYGAAPGSQPAEPRNTAASQQPGPARAWRAGQWVEVTGRVQRVLSDDNDGSRHQRFILQLPERRTLLIAHNIDLATPVPVRQGDAVRLRGRYEENERGGVIHWTHRDPQGLSRGGWIEHEGVRYQ